jgi:SM-20-related protein
LKKGDWLAAERGKHNGFFERGVPVPFFQHAPGNFNERNRLMSVLNLDAFRATPLVQQPFEYCIVPRFVRPAALEKIHADYPKIAEGGSFPLASLTYGPAFDALCQELRGPAMRDAFAAKFNMDLSNRPTTLTVRGKCRQKDGKIHVDSKSKLITVLVYLNSPWEAAGGRLRLLNNLHDLDNYFAEVPPEQGTLLCFRNGPDAWHGHKSFSGERRVMQLNWVVDQAAADTSSRRHGLSALLKKLNPFRKAA